MTELDEPSGVSAGAASDVQDVDGRRRQIARDQLLRPFELKGTSWVAARQAIELLPAFVVRPDSWVELHHVRILIPLTVYGAPLGSLTVGCPNQRR